MLSLAVHRKISISEDVLTAAVFDSLDQYRQPHLLSSLLRSSRSIDRTSPDVPRFDDYDIELWPQTQAGEPDVRITLFDAGVAVARFLVEAKLGAPKSGVGELSEDERRGDQIARYLICETRRPTASPLIPSIVYLTHHASVPRQQLLESISFLGRSSFPELARRVFWLSWRDVEAIFARAKGPVFAKIVVLFRRVSMFRFSGFHSGSTPNLPLTHLRYVTDHRHKTGGTVSLAFARRPVPQLPSRFAYRSYPLRKYDWSIAPQITRARFYVEAS